jgi:hypothetical protein
MINEQQPGQPASKRVEAEPVPDQPIVYQIRIKCHLGSDWTDWFEGLNVTQEENGDTLLTGPVVDQPALHGLLKKVRDLGMALVSVNRIEAGQTDTKNIQR